MDTRPETITWRHCTCGHSACKRQYPANLGTHYQGSGFEPEEVEWLNAAWSALNEREALPSTIEEQNDQPA